MAQCNDIVEISGPPLTQSNRQDGLDLAHDRDAGPTLAQRNDIIEIDGPGLAQSLPFLRETFPQMIRLVPD